MAGYSRITLLGNLTRDPETKQLGGDNSVTNFGMAINRKFKTANGDWKEQVTFVDVTFWGRKGAAFARFHSRGSQAFIDGELRMDQWEDKNTGAKRTKHYVVAQEFEFVGPKDGGGSAPSGGGNEPAWAGSDDAPF